MVGADAAVTDVVVVGAGPVGLMLAGELRLGGADVTVLERLAAPTTQSRASTLHARTMELLRQRGLLDEPGGFGDPLPPHEPRGHFGGLPLDLTLPSPYPGQWKVPQVRTEELLGARAARLGARVLRGHEVTGLAQDARQVTVTARHAGRRVTFTARYVVGCDGEQSAVRRLAGVGFPGNDAERELIRADVDGIEIPGRRFERLPKGLAIAARRGDGVTRVMVHRFGAPPRAGEADFADIVAAWREVTGEDISHGTPLWVNAFGDASRQAERYRSGRVLLAGDAAHQQMPIGGQALNLGLQDAVNLGWKLAATVRGRAPEGLLDTYHEERHAVGRRVLSNIRAQARLLLGGPEVEALRSVIGELTSYERVRAHLAGMISGLDVRYGGDSGPRLVGSRLPEAALLGTDAPPTTLDLLRPARGVLLVLTGAAEAFAGVARPWSGAVDTVTARPADRGALPDAAALLVRPDGYIAWAGDTPDGLEAALARWFTPDARTGTAPHLGPHLGPHLAPHPAHPHRHHNVRRRKMGNLTGKTALVTGASRGMGRATAERLARDGALVAVHYGTSEDAAAEVVAGIEKDGGRAFAVRAELGTPGDVHELFLALEEGLKERTGSTELNILVNNAGVMGGVKPEDTTPEQFDRIFAVNAKAPFFIVQRALANMPDGGRIVNISSGLTRFANPDEIAYAMSKGAIEQLALHYAKALGPRGITVNSVAPGITRNGNPLFDIPEAVEAMAALSTFNRVGEPQDVADVVAFLVSDDARWVTGSFVDASGGTLLG
ncbi:MULTISPECIES: SDR family oxidoreductase [unclassified Streptomyces]|uniref:SDR family oxidoreductase n=1 Tax=unclassified Streptomyces TaxID=2593676 RepID=UPI0014885B0B|nr:MULTISPECIES: SDR family oxidoreductase [unclassified Streptomyces]